MQSSKYFLAIALGLVTQTICAEVDTTFPLFVCHPYVGSVFSNDFEDALAKEYPGLRTRDSLVFLMNKNFGRLDPAIDKNGKLPMQQDSFELDLNKLEAGNFRIALRPSDYTIDLSNAESFRVYRGRERFVGKHIGDADNDLVRVEMRGDARKIPYTTFTLEQFGRTDYWVEFLSETHSLVASCSTKREPE